MKPNLPQYTDQMLTNIFQTEYPNIFVTPAPNSNQATIDRANRTNRELEGVRQNLPAFLRAVSGSSNFKTYDLRSEDVYEIDIGQIDPELELDLFNAIRVNANIPFVVLNRDRKKDVSKKGRYISEDRNFKICHSTDTPYPHDKLISIWKDDIKGLNLPETLIMKVFLPNENERKVRDQSYVDVIYRFDEGAAIYLGPGQTKADAERVVAILREQIVGFEVNLGPIKELSGSFVLDYVTFDRYALRWMLMNPFKYPNDPSVTTPFHFWPFLWMNERDKSLTARSHLKLKFKFGNITSKIVISTSEAEPRDLFYQNGIPVRFNKGQVYNSISIKKVKSVEHAIFIKQILTLASLLYRINRNGLMAQEEIGRYVPAAVISGLINVVDPSDPNTGVAPSFEITTTTVGIIPGKENRNFINKQFDPTFYGSIPTTKYISSSKRPAQIKVSTRDPNWQMSLRQLMIQFPEVQVIRYPLQIIGSPEFQETPRTLIPPYFLFADTSGGTDHSVFLKPRVNPEPVGSEGTFHPYLFTCINKVHFEVPGGNDAGLRYAALIDLTTPYVVRYIRPAKATESSHVKKTMKILRPGEMGFIPGPLEVVLGRFMMSGRYRDGAGIERLIATVPQFKRMGSLVSTASILHVLIANSPKYPELKDRYFSMSNEDREKFVQTTLRQKIVQDTNWNIARQELYDWELDDMRREFLNPQSFVDTKLFKTVLEVFFGVYLLVIVYDRENSIIEVPRHKFCYYHPLVIANSQPFLLFKHSGAKSFTSPNPQYETVELLLDQEGVMMTKPWDIQKLIDLFSLQNRTIDVHFSTVFLKRENVYQTGSIVDVDAERKSNLLQIFNKANLEYQFIDGAGKLRAFVHVFKSSGNPNVKRVTVACEPLAPTDLECFDDLVVLQARAETMRPDQFLAPQDFQVALDFVQSLGVSPSKLTYHMEFESLVAVDEPVVAEVPDTRKIQDQKDVQETAAKEKAKLKSMSLQEKIAAAKAGGPKARAQRQVVAKAEVEELTQEALSKKVPARKVVKKVNANPKAIGIWFNMPGHSIQFYIATTPGTPITKDYAINNEPFFNVEPENVYFRQHDEFERIANVMIQLARNLYIYSRWDDVDRFMDALTVVDPRVIYDVRSVRRQIPTDRTLSESPTSPLIKYPELFPTFFIRLEGDRYFRLVFDSELTKKRVRQHLKIVQSLKENIIGASGSKFREYRDATGVRLIEYTPFINEQFGVPRIGIDDQMIDSIPRLSAFYNRPLYIIEFYAYASDFARRGPDQNILMSSGEMHDYLNLTLMEMKTPVLTHPLPATMREYKFPVHYAAPDGSLYIIQNVEGASLLRVNNLILTWFRERVNLGYFSPELNLEQGGKIAEIKMEKINLLDPTFSFSVIDYGNGQYGALLKLEGSITDRSV